MLYLTPVCKEITEKVKRAEVLLSWELERLEKTKLRFIFLAHVNTSQTLVLSSQSLSLYYFLLSLMTICAAKSGSVLFFWLCGAGLIHRLERESFHDSVYTSTFISMQTKYLRWSIHSKTCEAYNTLVLSFNSMILAPQWTVLFCSDKLQFIRKQED